MFEDTSVTLPCSVVPDNDLTFTWLFQGEVLNLPSEGMQLLSDGSLSIASVSAQQEGIYTCVVINTLGSAQGEVALDILGKACMVRLYMHV